MRHAFNIFFLALLHVPAATKHLRWPPWRQRLFSIVLLCTLALALAPWARPTPL
jgi:hypothetical protein